MICAYCNKEKQATKEHIIPKGIIDLFPECNLSYSGFDKVHGGEATIKDVCSECNNGQLSKLDKYGKEFVETYFINNYNKGDKVDVDYDYNRLIRWLLKIIYNNERSYHRDVEWFKKNIDYILDGGNLQYGNISLFAGLAVNVSCVPEFFMENRQVNIITNPLILINGLFNIKYDDNLRVIYERNDTPEKMEINYLFNKYIIRFGSELFVIFLWNDDANEDYILDTNKIMDAMYPYRYIRKDECCVNLERCTQAYNYHMPLYIDSYKGLDIADASNCFVGNNKKAEDITRELSVGWSEYVANTRKEAKVKKNNKRDKKNKRKQQNQSKKINR